MDSVRGPSETTQAKLRGSVILGTSTLFIYNPHWINSIGIVDGLGLDVGYYAGKYVAKIVRDPGGDYLKGNVSPTGNAPSGQMIVP